MEPNKQIPYTSELAMSKQEGFSVRFCGMTYPIESLRDASDKWVVFRDESGAGASEIGNGVPVFNKDGKQVARISYNGRIWNGVDDFSDYPDLKPVQQANAIDIDVTKLNIVHEGLYSGKILHVMGGVAVQKIGRGLNEVARHDVEKLSEKVRAKDIVGIEYKDGVGIVTGLKKDEREGEMAIAR